MPSDDLAFGDAAVAEAETWITAMPIDDLASGDAAVASRWFMDHSDAHRLPCVW